MNHKRKFHLSQAEWAGLVNTRQQLEQPLPLTGSEAQETSMAYETELAQKRQIVQQQAAEISRLRWQVRYLQAQLDQAAQANGVSPALTSASQPTSVIQNTQPAILSSMGQWAELPPAWQNGDLGIRPWQAEPTRSQRRVQVELPHFARR